MLSFSEFVLEAIEPLPGKNRGFVDYKEIDGHKVHVRYYRKGMTKSSYVPTVMVDGAYHKEKNHSPETNARITAFVRSSAKSFLKNERPSKVTIKGNTEKKQKIYNTFAKAPTIANAGYSVKAGSNKVVLSNPENKTYHVPSGNVPYNASNPAHELPRPKKKSGKGSAKAQLWGDHKKWKNKKKYKGDMKSSKWSLKGAIWGGVGSAASGGW